MFSGTLKSLRSKKATKGGKRKIQSNPHELPTRTAQNRLIEFISYFRKGCRTILDSTSFEGDIEGGMASLKGLLSVTLDDADVNWFEEAESTEDLKEHLFPNCPEILQVLKTVKLLNLRGFGRMWALTVVYSMMKCYTYINLKSTTNARRLWTLENQHRLAKTILENWMT